MGGSLKRLGVLVVILFTNTSSRQLWVASLGQGTEQVYSGTSQCGGSAFDSCRPIAPGGWLEFTFTESGTWSYEDNLDKSYTGTITVS